MFLQKLIGFSAMAIALTAAAASSNTPVDNTVHFGPTISAYVQRGPDRLPIFLVDHLHKGDKLSVSTNKGTESEGSWLLVIATVSQSNNKVNAQKFDLTGHIDEPSIDIGEDDQIPIIVLAPQVRTMFGLHISFSESASLIIDAIREDPQRFVDLQKVDLINRVIGSLTAMLDSVIQSQTPEQAVASAKALASKFGVTNVDSDCFKDKTVNTNCVALAIISSKNSTLSASGEVWSSSGPNSSAAKIPTDIFASLKVLTEATTYLADKYGDNYDIAPTSGQRQRSGNDIQLVTSARFKSGYVKTAYVYVPSWFTGKPPEVTIAGKGTACLTKGELTANLSGLLPLENYWHDWAFVLHERGSPQVLAHLDTVDFNPDIGLFSFDLAKGGKDLPLNGQVLDATMTGKFGFDSISVPPFKVELPTDHPALAQFSGLDSLVSGEHGKLRLAGTDGNACIKQVTVADNGRVLATGNVDAHSDLVIDLNKIEPGPATLEIQQFGAEPQIFPIVIRKRRAHIQRLVHFDLENSVTAYGDNLDRIDTINAGHLACHPEPAVNEQDTSTTRVFSCPAEIALNVNFPAQVTVIHQDQEPASFDFPMTKIGARPHMTVDGARGSIITTLSRQGLQWGLKEDDPLLTEDSGLGILLHAFDGYALSRGQYVLQLKFADDPHTEQTPISVPMMSNLAHNELRTRNPISFANLPLPSVVNPLWYRVQHQPSGLVGDWQPLYRSVVYIPQFSSVTCSPTGNGFLIHGDQLDLIDSVGDTLAQASTPQSSSTDSMVSLIPCDGDLCLSVQSLGVGNKLKIKLHWIDDRIFGVTFPDVPKCAVGG